MSAAYAGAEASRLVERLRVFTLENPSDPSALPQWNSASPGKPLLIRLLDGTPSEYIVPMIDTKGKAISIIGVGASSGRWRWYSGEYPEGKFPPIGADEAADRVREFLRERGIPAGVTAPEARLSPDKRLYWHVRPEGFLPLYDVYLPAFASEKPRTNLDTPPWKSDRVLETAGALENGDVSGGRSGSPVAGERRAAATSAASAQAHEIPNVPYHEQQESYWCGPASLEMVFDYWGEDIPQAEIAAVSNASPGYGVYANELARAAHFSSASTAIQNPSLSGYTSRSQGYGMADASWSDGSSMYSYRFSDLKNMVAHDYPVLVLTDYNDGLNSGHFRVVKGYDDRLGTFSVHDPWYSPQPYAGPDVKFEQSFFVDRLWQYSDRWGMVAAPWSVSVSKPAYVSEGQSFTVAAQVTYRGVDPLTGESGVADPIASLETSSNGYQVMGGQVNMPVEGLDRMGSTGTATWTLRALSSRLTDDIRVVAQGLVQGDTRDYRRYTDWIGGTGSTGGATPFTPTSRTWGHDSVGVSAASEVWYLAEGCTSGGFETWVLVQNPNPTPANINLTYMTKTGAVPGPGANLPANSRMTFNVADTVPGQWSVSTMVSSDKPVVAERSMYGDPM